MFPRLRLRFTVVALVAITMFMLIVFEVSDFYHYKLEDLVPTTSIINMGAMLQQELQSFRSKPPSRVQPHSSRRFKPGNPKPSGQTYTKTVVLGKKQEDDTAWLDIAIPHNVEKAIYIVDDPTAPLHPPQNKGNEAMVYLSYIIDHYDNLNDISIFMHQHRWAWHNNDLLDNDSAMVIKHLLPQRIMREGYVNLRCQWYPGCPLWIDTSVTTVDKEKEEEILVKRAWSQLFPGEPLPSNLAQTCCSQFALSRQRILEVPLTEYTRLRDWLLETNLQDNMSGRLFEYLWQYLWTGSPVLCPSQHACYCDLFGICFENEQAFQKWFEIRFYLRRDEWDLIKWDAMEAEREELVDQGMTEEADALERPPEDRYKEVKENVDISWIILAGKREEAIRNGKDPRLRAKIAGREPDHGDEE